MTTVRTGAPVLAALLVVGSLGACKSNSRYASNDTAAAHSAAGNIDTAGTPANPSANPNDTTGMASANDTAGTTGKWSNPSVIGFAVASNGGEVQVAKLAVTKATNPTVRAFARQMIADHSAMLAQSRKLATKLSATPDTTTGDASDALNHTHDEMQDLSSKARGADWDKDYMDKMVSDHQDALSKLQDAAKNTTDPQVRAALETATGKVQAHLTKAQDIDSKLK